MVNKYIFCHPKYLKAFIHEFRQDYETENFLFSVFLKIMTDQKLFAPFRSYNGDYVGWEITKDGNDPIPF